MYSQYIQNLFIAASLLNLNEKSISQITQQQQINESKRHHSNYIAF